MKDLKQFGDAYSTKEATGRSAPQGTSVHNLEITRNVVVHGNNFIPIRTEKKKKKKKKILTNKFSRFIIR